MSLSARTGLLAALLILLAGCGFHLRGSVILPELMATTYIQDSVPNSLILPKLKRMLIKNDVNVIDKFDLAANYVTTNVTTNDVAANNEPIKITDPTSEQTAVAVLQLLNENFSRRQLSSGSSTLIKEYELNYAITFTLYKQSLGKQNNDTLLANQTITITREQTFDEAQVLAKTTEQQKLQQEMIRDAARQILRRLQSIQYTNTNANNI